MADQQEARSEWEISKAIGSFFPDAQVATEEQEAGEEEAPPEDQAEAATDEVEDTPDDEPAAEESEEPSADEPFMVLVVNGQEHKIGSKEEAIPLARQGLHYTQEMQKLRDEQRRWEADREQERARLNQEKTTYAQTLQTLNETYSHVLGKDAPDWNGPDLQRLKTENPNEYLALREQWDQLSGIRSELGRLAREKQEEENKAFQKWVGDQQEAIKAKRPEWADAGRRQQDHTMIRDYALAQGVSEQELTALFDHRFWMILHDAARFRQAEATAGKAKRENKTTSKVAAPGAGKDMNTTNRKVQAAKKELARSGDMRAAGALFDQFFQKGR